MKGRILAIFVSLILVGVLSAAEDKGRSADAKEPPEILVQPMAQSVSAGMKVILFTSAAGYPPPTYQWRHNGNPMPAQTRPTLVIPQVQPKDAGNYDVVVSNNAGTKTSNAARVSVNTVTTGKTYVVKPGDNLLAASQKLGAGDTLLLRGGVYYLEQCGRIRPYRSGASWEKPITIAAYPGEKPILDATSIIKGKWEKYKGAMYTLDLEAAGWKKPRKLRFRHGTKGYPVSARYLEILWQDGVPGEGKALAHQIALSPDQGSKIYPKDYLEKKFLRNYDAEIAAVDRPGEFYYSPDEHRLYVWTHGSDDPNKHVIRAPCVGGIISLGRKQYCIVRGLVIRGSASSAITTYGASNLVIEDTEMSYMGDQMHKGANMIIRNCNLHHGFYNTVQGVEGYFLFEGNEVHHMGDGDTWGYSIIGGETWGMNLSNGHHHVIRSNYFHDNLFGKGLRHGGCIVHETWGKKGKPHETRTHHSVYENNVFDNCCFGLFFQGKDNVHHHIIRHNVFLKFTRNAVRMQGDNQDHLIANNVFSESKEGPIAFCKGYGYGGNFLPKGNILQGNIFVGRSPVFSRGAKQEENVVRHNQHLPQGKYPLNNLIQKAEELGADLSGVPAVRRLQR